MKGYRTIIVNALALIFAIATGAGFEITADVQADITTGALALANIGLRFITDTSAGKSA